VHGSARFRASRKPASPSEIEVQTINNSDDHIATVSGHDLLRASVHILFT